MEEFKDVEAKLPILPNKLDEINALFRAPRKQVPFNAGIKGFKRLLEENTHLSKSDKHKAVKAYKARVQEKLKEVATLYAEAREKGLDNDREV